METPTPQTPGAAGGTDTETPTQRQARLRRERREAKLRDQGTSRLEKITKVSGRQHLPGTFVISWKLYRKKELEILDLSFPPLPAPEFGNY